MREALVAPLRVEVQDYVAIVTMDNPPVNAITSDWPIQETFDSFYDRDDVRVAILTGAGTRCFCAGADVKARAESSEQAQPPGAYERHSRRTREDFNTIVDCAVPVIGAVNGHALGGGLALAASCDYLIASENATFGLPEIDVGLLGGARHFMRLFPQGVTRRANFTGRRLTAQEAYRLGVVVEVVPPEHLMEAAIEEARVIAQKMPVGIRMAKANLNLIESMDLKNGYRFEQTQTALLQKTEDAIEAKKAFAEKRAPVFKGR
jgi:enoyl-CoA hydratase/carnithine racemase